MKLSLSLNGIELKEIAIRILKDRFGADIPPTWACEIWDDGSNPGRPEDFSIDLCFEPPKEDGEVSK